MRLFRSVVFATLSVWLLSSCSAVEPYPDWWSPLSPAVDGDCEDISGSYKNKGHRSRLGDEALVTLGGHFFPHAQYWGPDGDKLYVVIEKISSNELQLSQYNKDDMLMATKKVGYKCFNNSASMRDLELDGKSQRTAYGINNYFFGVMVGDLMLRKNTAGGLVVNFEGRLHGCVISGNNGGCCIFPWSARMNKWELYDAYKAD